MPLEGRPLLMTKREPERSRVESALDDVVQISSMRDLPMLIQDYRGKLPRTLGLELDVLPVKDFFRFENLLGGYFFCR